MIFPTHAPINLVLNVEKKNIFFSKFEIREEIVVILSKTVILGLLPAPTTIIQILSEIFVRMTGPFCDAGSKSLLSPPLGAKGYRWVLKSDQSFQLCSFNIYLFIYLFMDIPKQ